MRPRSCRARATVPIDTPRRSATSRSPGARDAARRLAREGTYLLRRERDGGSETLAPHVAEQAGAELPDDRVGRRAGRQVDARDEQRSAVDPRLDHERELPCGEP